MPGGATQKAKIRARWEGDVLVQETDTGAFKVTRRIRMDASGKSMSAEWTLNQGSEVVTAKEVWEKQ